MGIEESLRIDRILGTTPAEGTSKAHTDPVEFRRLLETLEGLAKKPNQPVVDDVEQLETAVRHADHDFKQVMNLREMLEAAYHRALP